MGPGRLRGARPDVRTGARREHRRRCKRVWLMLGAVALCVGGALLAVGLTHGVEGLRWFFGARWLEAHSGRKYTPTGAVKRYIEKLGEKGSEE